VHEIRRPDDSSLTWDSVLPIWAPLLMRYKEEGLEHENKQILSVLAYDGPTADTVAQAWAGLDASVKADTIIVVTQTDGDDTFIYTNN